MVKQYKQKRAVSFARILAIVGRSFVELTKKVTQNNQKCYSKLLTAYLKYATMSIQNKKEAMMGFDSEIQNIWEAMQKLRRMGLTNSAAYIALNNAMQEISILEKNIANKQLDKALKKL